MALNLSLTTFRQTDVFERVALSPARKATQSRLVDPVLDHLQVRLAALE